MAVSLGHRYGVSIRFFTLYGPRQRPDLAIHKFASPMLHGEPIPVSGDGSNRLDYTDVDDIIQGVRAAIELALDAADGRYEVINLGNDRTVSLEEMIEALERVLGVAAKRESQPEQPGDVHRRRRPWRGRGSY